MTLVNGVSQTITLDGNIVYKVPSNYIVSAKDFNFINTKAGLTPEQAIVIEGLYSAALTGFIDANEKGLKKIEWEDKRVLAGVNANYVDLIHQSSQESIFLINENLNIQKEKRRKQQRQSKQIKRNAEAVFNDFLNEVTSIVVDYAKEQINKLLPADLSFDINVESVDGALVFKGMNVGDIAYNATDNTISYKGDIFSGVAQQGLDAVNEQLPEFMQVSLSASTIGLGNITLDLDDLFNNPDQKFSLSSSVSAQAIGDQIVVYLADIPYNVGLKNKLVAPGLDGLNRLLPSGLKATAEFKEGYLLPVVGIGPVQLDLTTGDLVFDAAGAKDLVTNQLESKVFNQLPAPVAAIGRAAWKALGLDSFFGGSTTEVEVSANDSLVINGLSYTGESLTPSFSL